VENASGEDRSDTRHDNQGRAAQYVRMSTDHQKYSTENQAEVLARYAAQRGIVIVRTYADEGKSGLRLDGRDALKQLIDDVQGKRTNFATILVYDVSRWGEVSGCRRERLLRIQRAGRRREKRTAHA
jgi:DNA invertase Pin-like site-specific DNA recombinase